MSRILALDLGTRTGWAVSIPESGVWDFTPHRFEGAGMRFVRFRQALNTVLDDVQLVYFEEVRRHIGTDAAHVYGGLMAVLTEECERRKIPYAGVPVATIKKHATGKGNSDKDSMVRAARTKWENPLLDSVQILDDNHADALWLLDYARSLG